jgi:hypothetical protein
VLQEYSTRPIEDPLAMSDAARKFGDEIRKAGAKTVLFLTWARYNQPENQAVLTQAYDKVGREIGAIVVRVGPAWERVIDEKPSIKLHMGRPQPPHARGQRTSRPRCFMRRCCTIRRWACRRSSSCSAESR